MAASSTPSASGANGKEVYLVASGDLRLAANQNCWPAQQEMERTLAKAVEEAGYKIVRAHGLKEQEKHGFIASQREGMSVFRKIPPAAPLIVAEAVWQYSHHVLAGLSTHRGPILTVANWSGQWPGLVGMLNLNGSLTKAGVSYSTLWSEQFEDDYFKTRLAAWLTTGRCTHDTSHAVPYEKCNFAADSVKLGQELAATLQHDKAIMGVFDEGCMGMFNAIIPDHLLHPTGVFKERMSQSALYYETTQVSDDEARAVRRWLEDRGMKFHTGPKHETDLTDEQIHQQCKMYIAAVRLADDFGCDLIGIQYQQGLKDLLPASDLVEGTLNNSDRPPVNTRDGKRVLYDGQPVIHFNEVDECAGLDALVTNRVQRALGQPVETTLHDVRWADADQSGTTKEYVWVFEISGSAPPAHFEGGWAGAEGFRQPAMYFPNGGSTLRGISKPGEIVWSRIYVEDNRLAMDIGRGAAISLPRAETERRWNATTPQWPIMHAVLNGVSRDQMMARHKSNHIQVSYALDAAAADRALAAKAAMAHALGLRVSRCGDFGELSRAAGKPVTIMANSGHNERPVGMIGLGLLGTALAERLLGAGYKTVVWNRSREKADSLIARGARWSDNPLTECDRAVICLYTTDIVEDVLEQMESGLRSGQILIDTTTGDPSQTTVLAEKLARRGVDYLESPIAASSEQTRQGQAMAIVAGPQQAFEASHDLFDALAAKTFHVGPWGSAAKVKLVNNLVLGLNRVALAEGLVFARAIGLDPGQTLDVLKQGNSYSVVMDTKGRKMVEGDFSLQAKLSQHAKDVRIILEQAKRGGASLPLSELHLRLLGEAEAAGLGEEDNSAIIRAIEARAAKSK